MKSFPEKYNFTIRERIIRIRREIKLNQEKWQPIKDNKKNSLKFMKERCSK